MDSAEQLKNHRRWLIVLVVLGLVLAYGIFRMLLNAPGHGDAPVDQHPQQAVP